MTSGFRPEKGIFDLSFSRTVAFKLYGDDDTGNIVCDNFITNPINNSELLEHIQ